MFYILDIYPPVTIQDTVSLELKILVQVQYRDTDGQELFISILWFLNFTLCANFSLTFMNMSVPLSHCENDLDL